MPTKKDLRRTRIRKGIRRKISGTPERPRLSVFRSNTSIYAQLIDDVNGVTLGSASSKTLDATKGNKSEVSSEVGKALAQKANELGVKEVVFDRNGYLYHGRLKAFADGAREGGLKI